MKRQSGFNRYFPGTVFHLFILLLCVVSFFPSVAWGAPTYTFKLGNSVAEDHPYTLGCLRFKELVEERTKGDIVINVFPNGQLGTGERDLIEGLQLGTVEMYLGSTGPMAGFEKKFLLFDFPFLFKNKKHVYAVLDGEIGTYILGLLDKLGIKGLGWAENGFRNFTNSKRPIHTSKDVAGLKLRTMENKAHMAMWRALKADPTPMAFSELFTALQQGTIDGEENPIPIIYTSKFYEVQKHLALTRHVFSPSFLAIAKPVFDSLPPDYQEIVLTSAKEAVLYEREQITKMEEEQISLLKERGMEITEPNLQEFREETKSVYADFRGELGDDAKLLEKIIEIGKQY